MLAPFRTWNWYFPKKLIEKLIKKKATPQVPLF
jgi:hypothetical protein